MPRSPVPPPKHSASMRDLQRFVVVVFGEPAAALTGGGLTCEVPYDLETVRAADLVIVPDWQNPPHQSGSQAQYVQVPLPPLDEADPVGEALTWALGQLDRALPVEHLARRARMSRRNFDRRFRAINYWNRPACRLRRWRGGAGSPPLPRSGRTSAASWVSLRPRTGSRSGNCPEPAIRWRNRGCRRFRPTGIMICARPPCGITGPTRGHHAGTKGRS